jgi:predicted Zn-dependent protease
VQRIDAQVAKLGGDFTNRTVGRERYLQSIDNVVFGANPREGYFQGNTFIHPELAFQIRFPEGWKTSNQKDAVGAMSPNQDALVMLRLAPGSSPQEAARAFFAQQGIQQGEAVRANLSGLPAVTSTFGVQRGQGGNLIGVASFVESAGKVYQILGYTTENRWGSYDDLLSGAIGTFSRVTDRKALDVQPRRVDVVSLPSAMTLSEFARRYPSTVDLTTLAIINQAEESTRFQAGSELKRVVGGEPTAVGAR